MSGILGFLGEGTSEPFNQAGRVAKFLVQTALLLVAAVVVAIIVALVWFYGGAILRSFQRIAIS